MQRKMKRAGLVLMFVPLFLQSQTTRMLMGTWESVARTEAGIGMVLEFRNASEVIMHTAVMVDFAYELKGDQLISTFSDAETKEVSVDTSTVVIIADSLIRTDRNGVIERMVMVPPRADDSGRIEGTWSLVRGGKQGTLRFTADGRAMLRLALGSEKARYEFFRADLVMTTGAADRIWFNYRVAGDSLVLKGKNDPVPQVYVRPR